MAYVLRPTVPCHRHISANRIAIAQLPWHSQSWLCSCDYESQLRPLPSRTSIPVCSVHPCFSTSWFRCLLTSSVPLSHSSPPRSSGASRFAGTRSAESPSFRGSSQATRGAAPTRSRAPEQDKHPLRQIAVRRKAKAGFRATVLRATFPTALRHEDLAAAPQPSRAAPESAPAIAQTACRRRTPRQKTTSLARAALFRLYTPSSAKSSVWDRHSCLSPFLSSLATSTPCSQPLTAFFPSKVKTLPLNFTTPFNAPVGIRKISSNSPVIAVKNSSMLSSRSRVYGSPCVFAFDSATHSARTRRVGSISRRLRSSLTIRKISQTSLMDSKWSRRSPKTCTTRTIPHPCSSRRQVLTFERATDSVLEISSAGIGTGERNSSACTCATVRLMPQRVPISPQCRMNFCATGVSVAFVVSVISVVSLFTEHTAATAICQALSGLGQVFIRRPSPSAPC